MTMLYEAHRMSTIEPFNISIPKPKLPDFVDKTKDKAGKVTKDIGNKAKDGGKLIGGKLIDIGKGIGKVLGPAFKKLLEFFMMILKNWKIALGVVVALLILYIASRISGFFRMFTG